MCPDVCQGQEWRMTTLCSRCPYSASLRTTGVSTICYSHLPRTPYSPTTHIEAGFFGELCVGGRDGRSRRSVTVVVDGMLLMVSITPTTNAQAVVVYICDENGQVATYLTCTNHVPEDLCSSQALVSECGLWAIPPPTAAQEP